MLRSMFPPKRAAIFDLDGTLLDSMWVWKAVDRRFCAARGRELTQEYVKNIQSMTFREAAEHTISWFQLDERPEEVMAEWVDLSQEEYRQRVKLKPGAREYLEKLRDQGVILGVATALSHEMLRAVLENNGVFGYFSALTSVEDVSRGKKFPDIYNLTAERLGVEPAHCVAFDDIEVAMIGIRAAGMTSCAVQEENSVQDWQEMCRLSDLQLQKFEDVI